MLADRSVQIARSKLGVKTDSPFVLSVRTWLDAGNGWMAKPAPWCAAFASWCVAQAATELKLPSRFPHYGATESFFKFFVKNGLLLPSPEAFSIGMLRGDGGIPGRTHHHTFFVEGIDGDFVRGIDGNWEDAVSVSHHPIKNCDFGPIV